MLLKPSLLTRTAFRDGVFTRDHGKCVFCGNKATEAHHIMERRLWDNGGYYIDNGCAVCGPCHLKCEATLISVEDARLASGITKPIIPDHLYDDVYDKWGNPILPNGLRLRGELYFDESVRKILTPVQHLFTNRVRFPRTFHVPWSPGIHDDDRVIPTMAGFVGKRVIVHEKYDGENSSLYSDFMHARSPDGQHHPSRNWVKNLWGNIRHEIPTDWRIIVENMYAKHSIYYDDLPSYAIGFQVWDERNWCLPWDDTQQYLEILGIVTCPVLYDGIYDESNIRKLDDRDWNQHEGYVIRLADGFSYRQYRQSVAKFVRRGHIQTTRHWMHGQAIERNRLSTSCHEAS